jgi:hypothetical protein
MPRDDLRFVAASGKDRLRRRRDFPGSHHTGPSGVKKAQKPARAAVYLSRAIEPKGGREPSARKPAWRRFNPFATLWNDRHLPERTATIDVKRTLSIV